MKYIIFGICQKGFDVYRSLGKSNIIGFLDNDASKIPPDNLPHLDFNDIKDISNSTVVVCANRIHQWEMCRQLYKIGILNYITYDEFVEAVIGTGGRGCKQILNNLNIVRADSKILSNQESEVEFYLTDSFEIYHFLPIYKALNDYGINAEIVAEPCFINTAGEWFDFEHSVELLNEIEINYSTSANTEAKIAITTQYPRNLCKYKGLKMNLCYGEGANKKKKSFLQNYEVVNGFDYLLVHGKFGVDKLKKFSNKTKFFIIGYPKYIDCFNIKYDKNSILKELGIITNKPILIYLPTWDMYSSIQEYANEILKLRSEFYIISKPHHCTARLQEKKKDLERLYEISDLVVDANYSNIKLTKIADFAISDALSGTFTEIPFLDNNIKMVSICAGDSNIQDLYDECKNMCKIISNPNDLVAIVNATYHNDSFLNNRKKIVSYLYDNNSEEDLKYFCELVSNIIERKE